MIQKVEKEMSKQKGMKHLSSRGLEGALSGHFVLAVASDWKCAPALSLYAVCNDR